MIFLITLAIASLLLSLGPVHSDDHLPSPVPIDDLQDYNNTVAIAVPLGDIQIDGDLADWPGDMPFYGLRERGDGVGPFDKQGALVDTSADFSPHFRVGYNLQDRSIYVAITARDDTLFAGDAAELYLHTTPDLERDPLHFVREYHEEEADISDNLDLLDALFSEQKRLAESGTRSAVGRRGDITAYEWALKLPDRILERLAEARSDVRIRFDLKVIDRDNDDGEFGLSWSPDLEKDGNARLLGCLFFADDRSHPVHIQGALKGEDGTPLAGLKIRVESGAKAWLDEISSGVEGRFSAWALPGSLQVTVKGLGAADTLHFSPGPGARPSLELSAPHFNEKIRPILVPDPKQKGKSPVFLEGARFRFGDDPVWATADFDDSDWDVVSVLKEPLWDQRLDVPQNSRIIWIRQRLIAEPGLYEIPLILAQRRTKSDSCTYYLNGSKLSNFSPKATDDRTVVTLAGDRPNLLAIRYASNRSQDFSDMIRDYNFRLDSAASRVQGIIEETQMHFANLSFFVGMPLILSIVHLLMFWFYRGQREHLHYALFTFSVVFGVIVMTGNEYLNWGSTIHEGASFVFTILLALWAYIYFISVLFDQRNTWLYRIFLGAAVTVVLQALNFALTIFLAKYNPLELTETLFQDRAQFYYRSAAPFTLLLLGFFIWFFWHQRKLPYARFVCWSAAITAFPGYFAIVNFEYVWVLFIAFMVTGSWGFCVVVHVVYRAVRRRMFGAVTMATGVTMHFISIYGAIAAGIIAENLGYRPEWRLFFASFTLGHFALIMISSIHLARIVGRTGRNLEEQLVQVETLSRTNIEQERALRQRMEEELEEAHQLQLSMLPKQVPQLGNIEIGWYMKTATEVGGDYYDYRVDGDRLILVLGDATGHGMQAGTLVTATKSLFQSLTEAENLAVTLTKMSNNLKSMNLGRTGMALTMVELDGRHLRYCPAGIPPILIYRAREQQVEEGQSGGLPLGLTDLGLYQEAEVNLHPGDAVLLMSDGLPERINAAQEEFGYERVQDLFLQVVEEAPANICKLMAAGGDEWAGNAEQEDDVSFVVLRAL